MKMFDPDKTRMIGLPYGENYDNMLSRFHIIPERHGRTDGRTDIQTDRTAISISRVSVLTRDKNVSLKTVALMGVRYMQKCVAFFCIFSIIVCKREIQCCVAERHLCIACRRSTQQDAYRPSVDGT